MRALIKHLLIEYQFFTKLPQISHCKYNKKLTDILLLPYTFYGRDMYGIHFVFFIFASCEPLY